MDREAGYEYTDKEILIETSPMDPMLTERSMAALSHRTHSYSATTVTYLQDQCSQTQIYAVTGKGKIMPKSNRSYIYIHTIESQDIVMITITIPGNTEVH